MKKIHPMSVIQQKLVSDLSKLVSKLQSKTKNSLTKLCDLITLYHLMEFKTYDAKNLIDKIECTQLLNDKSKEEEIFHVAKEEIIWMLDHTYSELISKRQTAG